MAAYPRKQTVFIFIICALVTGGTAFYVYGGFDGQPEASRTVPAAAAVYSDNEATGTIASNVDWQKQFLGSASSTGSYTVKNSASASVAAENLTVTDKMGREFLTKYAQLRQSGLSKDPQAVSNLMSEVTAESISQLPPPKSYSTKDISVIPSGTAAIRVYGDAILYGFQNYMPNVNEAQIANQAYIDGDMSELSQIDAVVDSYKKMVSYLLKTPVPAPLSSYHLNLTNGFAIALYNAQSLRHIDTDPLKGLAAISLELAAIKNITGAFADIQGYFVSAGVPFGS